MRPAGRGSDGKELSELGQAEIEKLVAQLEAEMKNAARQLEFERAAALRDEVQDIRLRVLEQDASVAVLKDAEKAAGKGTRALADGQAIRARSGTEGG